MCTGNGDLPQPEVIRERRLKIQPSRPSGKLRRCKLCPSDLQMLGAHYIQKALIYRLSFSNPSDFQRVLDSLKRSLAASLTYFYPLAGRLRSSEDSIVYIECSDEGAELVEASALEVSVNELLQEEVSPAVRKLFDLDGALNSQGHFLPLLVLQVTRLKDGVALGFSVNHAVLDGTSLWSFVNSFAELCQGSSVISYPPIHSRNFDIEGLPPISMKNLNVKPYSASDFSPPAALRERVFHFSKETILDLKRSANKNGNSETEISSYQSLCSHVWQAITRANWLEYNEETQFMLPVDCRRRKNPRLSPFYFGNAVLPLKVKSTAKEVVENHIFYPASLLNREISEYKDAEITEALQRFHREPFLVSIAKDSVCQNRVVMGSSPRLPVYEADFGWGKPEGVRSGWNNKSAGKISAYPGREGGGSVELEICLEAFHMQALERDPLFVYHRSPPLCSNVL